MRTTIRTITYKGVVVATFEDGEIKFFIDGKLYTEYNLKNAKNKISDVLKTMKLTRIHNVDHGGYFIDMGV